MAEEEKIEEKMVEEAKKDEKMAEEVKYGYYVAVFGMVIAALIFGAAMLRYSTAQDVQIAIGPLTTLIGTITGAFFGQQMGSAGRDKAQQTAIRLALASRMSPDELKKFLGSKEKYKEK